MLEIETVWLLVRLWVTQVNQVEGVVAAAGNAGVKYKEVQKLGLRVIADSLCNKNE